MSGALNTDISVVTEGCHAASSCQHSILRTQINLVIYVIHIHFININNTLGFYMLELNFNYFEQTTDPGTESTQGKAGARGGSGKKEKM